MRLIVAASKLNIIALYHDDDDLKNPDRRSFDYN